MITDIYWAHILGPTLSALNSNNSIDNSKHWPVHCTMGNGCYCLSIISSDWPSNSVRPLAELALYISSFNAHSSHVRWGLSSSLYYRWGNWSLGGVDVLPICPSSHPSLGLRLKSGPQHLSGTSLQSLAGNAASLYYWPPGPGHGLLPTCWHSQAPETSCF